jgi:hypothetical protein
LEQKPLGLALVLVVQVLVQHLKHAGACENAAAALGNLCVAPALQAAADAVNDAASERAFR